MPRAPDGFTWFHPKSRGLCQTALLPLIRWPWSFYRASCCKDTGVLLGFDRTLAGPSAGNCEQWAVPRCRIPRIAELFGIQSYIQSYSIPSKIRGFTMFHHMLSPRRWERCDPSDLARQHWQWSTQSRDQDRINHFESAILAQKAFLWS